MRGSAFDKLRLNGWLCDSFSITYARVNNYGVIARTQSEAKGTKQSDLEGHSEHVRFAQCRLREGISEIAEPVPSLVEGAAPRNDTACRIATLPLVARNDTNVTALSAFATVRV